MKLSISILIILLFHSCGSSLDYVKHQFKYHHEDRNTGIDSLININGYYLLPIIYKSRNKNDTTYSKFIFFKNGLIVYDFSVEDMNLANLYFYYGGSQFWGRYILCEDTIKSQIIHYGKGDILGYYGWENWYKVIDKNTIQLINWEQLSYESESDKRNHEIYKQETKWLPAKFIPFQNIPSPYKAWILEKKWFWKDENEWGKFMEKQR